MRIYFMRSLIAGLLIGGGLPLANADDAVPADTPALHRIPSALCKNCHEDIYRQWQGSMHARSTALADPIHGAFYNMEVGDPTAEGQVHKKTGAFPVCLHCHAPNASRDRTTKLDAQPAYQEGVNCVACHTLKSYQGLDAGDGKLRYGILAYTLSDTSLQAPAGFPRGLAALQAAAAADDPFGGAVAAASDGQKPNPHLGAAVEFDGVTIPPLAMETNPLTMKTSDACMGCHDRRNNPQNVALCATGDEFAASGSKVACQSCHMPIAGGIADHSMNGGHDLAMLQRSVVFALRAEPADGMLKTTVELRNPQPHAMPTGAPFRNMYIKLTAYDASGEAVWQNAEGHPQQADAPAYFHYQMVDDQGQPAPPPTATRAGPDSRLKPYETRELVYAIPADGVVLVRGELYYNLLWPSLVEKFKQLPAALTAPMPIAVSEQTIAAP